MKYSAGQLFALHNLRPGPVQEAEIAGLWQRRPRQTLCIGGVQIHVISPPVRKRVSRIADGEEYGDAGERGPQIQRRGEDVVVLDPPGKELRISRSASNGLCSIVMLDIPP